MLLLTILALTCTSTELPAGATVHETPPQFSSYQQFCHFRGHACFPVDHVLTDPNFDTIFVDNRDPIPIFAAKRTSLHALGENHWVLKFRTEWGDGLLIQNTDKTFAAEIPLKDNFVLSIQPCYNRNECTSFGYELLEDVDFKEELEEEVDETEEDPMDSRRFLENIPYETCYHEYEEGAVHGSWIDQSRYYCRPTLEVVFPNEYWGDEDLYQWYMDKRASHITYNFNMAMELSDYASLISISYTTIEEGKKLWTSVQFEIELLYTTAVDWDTSKTAHQNCREYRNSKIDKHTDLTHCIFDSNILGHRLGGRSRKIGTPYGRVSWAHKSTLQGEEHSSHRLSAHLLALNNGARKVFNDNNLEYEDGQPSLMIASDQPRVHQRGLYFYDTARRRDNGEQVNNIEELHNYMPILDTTPDEQNGNYWDNWWA